MAKPYQINLLMSINKSDPILSVLKRSNANFGIEKDGQFNIMGGVRRDFGPSSVIR